TLLADLCADLGATAEASTLVDALAPFEDRLAVLGHGIATIGAVCGPLGRLESILARPIDAERHLQQAVAVNEQLGAQPALAQAKIAYSYVLEESGDHDQQRTAAVLRAEATTLATAI